MISLGYAQLTIGMLVVFNFGFIIGLFLGAMND